MSGEYNAATYSREEEDLSAMLADFEARYGAGFLADDDPRVNNDLVLAGYQEGLRPGTDFERPEYDGWERFNPVYENPEGRSVEYDRLFSGDPAGEYASALVAPYRNDLEVGFRVLERHSDYARKEFDERRRDLSVKLSDAVYGRQLPEELKDQVLATVDRGRAELLSDRREVVTRQDRLEVAVNKFVAGYGSDADDYGNCYLHAARLAIGWGRQQVRDGLLAGDEERVRYGREAAALGDQAVFEIGEEARLVEFVRLVEEAGDYSRDARGRAANYVEAVAVMKDLLGVYAGERGDPAEFIAKRLMEYEVDHRFVHSDWGGRHFEDDGERTFCTAANMFLYLKQYREERGMDFFSEAVAALRDGDQERLEAILSHEDGVHRALYALAVQHGSREPVTNKVLYDSDYSLDEAGAEVERLSERLALLDGLGGELTVEAEIQGMGLSRYRRFCESYDPSDLLPGYRMLGGRALEGIVDPKNVREALAGLESDYLAKPEYRGPDWRRVSGLGLGVWR